MPFNSNIIIGLIIGGFIGSFFGIAGFGGAIAGTIPLALFGAYLGHKFSENIDKIQDNEIKKGYSNSYGKGNQSLLRIKTIKQMIVRSKIEEKITRDALNERDDKHYSLNKEFWGDEALRSDGSRNIGKIVNPEIYKDENHPYNKKYDEIQAISENKYWGAINDFKIWRESHCSVYEKILYYIIHYDSLINLFFDNLKKEKEDNINVLTVLIYSQISLIKKEKEILTFGDLNSLKLSFETIRHITGYKWARTNSKHIKNFVKDYNLEFEKTCKNLTLSI